MPLLTSNNNSFRSQRPDEKTILVVHRHWITLVGPFFFLFFFALLPFFVNGPIQQTSWYYDLADFYWFFITAYYLILWIAFFGNLMIYSLNTVVVTNQRIIENHQQGLFKHIENEMRLDKVQDVTVTINGVLANLLNFGDLFIQSAGTQNEFNFKTLPHPEDIKTIVMNARNECLHT